MSAFNEPELATTLAKIADKSDTVRGNSQLCNDASGRLRALFEALRARSPEERERVGKAFTTTAGDFLQMLRVQNHYRFLLFWLASSQRVVGSVKQVHVAVSRIYTELGAEPDMSEQQWVEMLNAGRLEQQRWLQEALGSSTNAMLINEMPNPLKLKETLTTMDNQLKLRFDENNNNIEEDASVRVKMRPEMAQLMKATRDRIINHTNMKPGEAFEWFISQEDIRRGELIGEGSYGKVYKATLTQELTGEKEEVALKVLQSMHGLDENRKFSREIEAWVKLEDDHVLQMIGANHVSKPKFFVMEYASEGNLEYFFRDVEDKGNKKLLWFLLGQAAKGLKVLHDENVEHGGLKTTNLLVAKNENGELVVKISDFGMSVIRTESVSVSTHAKKDMVRWKAPERLMQSTDGTDFRKADIYGLGLCAIDAASGIPPFMELGDEEIIEIKLENGRVPRPDVGLTDEEWVFLDRMCDPDPTQRPDLDEVIATMQALDKVRQENWTSIQSETSA